MGFFTSTFFVYWKSSGPGSTYLSFSVVFYSTCTCSCITLSSWSLASYNIFLSMSSASSLIRCLCSSSYCLTLSSTALYSATSSSSMIPFLTSLCSCSFNSRLYLACVLLDYLGFFFFISLPVVSICMNYSYSGSFVATLSGFGISYPSVMS